MAKRSLQILSTNPPARVPCSPRAAQVPARAAPLFLPLSATSRGPQCLFVAEHDIHCRIQMTLGMIASNYMARR